jgi:TolB-like protein/DNA-binding winged helix-turn-helix (wHTH) protein
MNDKKESVSSNGNIARLTPRTARSNAANQQNGYVAGVSSGGTTGMPDEDGLTRLEDGFRLGDFTVYPKRLELVGADKTVRLEYKVMAVLLYLAERADEVVTRREIFDRVWPNVVVGDEVLNRAIAILRSELGDDAHEPKYIMTVPRVGYRLIARVEPLHDDAKAPIQPPKIAPPRKPLTAALVLALLVAAAIVFIAPSISRLDTSHIAVLPFEPCTSADQYFNDGLAEEIMHLLANDNRISVVARTSSFGFRCTNKDVREIGKELRAGSLIEGEVRRDGDRLRITVRQIDANSGDQVWSESYDKRTSDIFDVQYEIAQAIVHRRSPSASIAQPPPPTSDMAAYTLFLRANQQLRRRDLPHAIDLFEQAIARDPNFARAFEGLAEAYILLPSYAGSSEKAGHALAEDALEKAEALGEDPRQASGIRAYMQYRMLDWRGAAQSFDQALKSPATPWYSKLLARVGLADTVKAPSSDDAEVWQWYSQYLASVGWMEQSRRAAEEAVTLDPLSPAANQRAAFLDIWSDIKKADDYFSTAEEGTQGVGLPEARIAYLLTKGDIDEARKKLLATQALRGQSTAWIDPAIAAVTGTGSVAAAIDALRHDFRNGTLGVSMYFGALFMIGDADAMYEAMPEIIASGEPFDVEVFFSPKSASLRSDPRFVPLMQQLRLVDFWNNSGMPDMCTRGAGVIQCR